MYSSSDCMDVKRFCGNVLFLLGEVGREEGFGAGLVASRESDDSAARSRSECARRSMVGDDMKLERSYASTLSMRSRG